MGQCAAINIINRIVADEQASLDKSAIQPEQQTLPPFPQMMSLAVGNVAVSHGPDESVKTGEKVKEMMFGNDLGLSRKFSCCFVWYLMRCADWFRGKGSAWVYGGLSLSVGWVGGAYDT